MNEGPPTQATPESDVFVSYASQDAYLAHKLVETLERDGIRCWIAPRDVKGGAQYADAIMRALTNARAMVLVLSANSIASPHVGKEIERASSKKRPIIALRTDSAPLTPALEYFLSESQWIEDQEGKAEAYAKLIDAIRDPERTPPPGTSAAPTPAAPPKSRPKRILLAAGLAIVAVTLAVFFAPRFWLPRHSPAEQPTTIAASTSTIHDKSIAVLPFVDMSEKHDQEYFGDGMAEEILDLLTKTPDLTVIGRTSSFQFKGKTEDLRTIGSKLNAAYVLEGSVRNSGGQVRITAQLINTRTGTHEWSETYDRPIGDVLKLQNAIAAGVVRELQLTVAPDYSISRATPKDAEVYDLYLRGRHAFDRHDGGGLAEAATLFQRALDRDPAFTDAAVWLSWARQTQGMFNFLAPTVAFDEARRAAATALKRDPKRADAHAAIAQIHIIYDWDWVAGERECQQASTLAPGSMDALYCEEMLSQTLGRWDDGLRQVNAALAQDPLDPDGFSLLSAFQANRGHLPEAEAALRRLLDIQPTYGFVHYYFGTILLARGDYSGALLEMQQETTDEGKEQGLAMVYYVLGRKVEANAALANMLKDQADRNAFGIATVYAVRGQVDEAIRWLERAYAQKDAGLYGIKSELPLQRLAADPQFKAFLKKMNLPE
jgi:TolB-like protein/Flp pilus assembly protein TadD